MLWSVRHQLRKLDSDRPERQISAMQRLGKSRDPRALRPLFQFFVHGSSTPAAHRAALETLAGYRDRESLDFFLGKLEESDHSTVEGAAEVLAAMKYGGAVAPLIRAVREDRGGNGPARSLIRLEAFEPLADLMERGHLSSTALARIVAACKESGRAACVNLLLPLVQSAHSGLRRGAVEAISSLDREAARQALMKTLPLLDFEGLLLCVPAVGLTEKEWLESERRIYYQIYRAYFEPAYALDSACTDKLLAILQSPDESVRGRTFAAARLRRDPDARAVRALREVMRSGAPGVWREAARAFYGGPGAAEDSLDRLLAGVAAGRAGEIDTTTQPAISLFPPGIVERLIEEDPRHAAAILEKLKENGWRPRTPGETAVDHILHQRWNELAATRGACVAPLVELALNDSGCFDDTTRYAAASALEAAVEKLHAELPEKTLRYLSNLGDVVREEEEVGAEIRNYIYSWTGMRGCIRRELERRELGHHSPGEV